MQLLWSKTPIQQHIPEYSKNSLTMAAEPLRVITSLVSCSEAMAALNPLPLFQQAPSKVGQFRPTSTEVRKHEIRRMGLREETQLQHKRTTQDVKIVDRRRLRSLEGDRQCSGRDAGQENAGIWMWVVEEAVLGNEKRISSDEEYIVGDTSKFLVVWIIDVRCLALLFVREVTPQDRYTNNYIYG